MKAILIQTPTVCDPLDIAHWDNGKNQQEVTDGDRSCVKDASLPGYKAAGNN
jgi:hypothetical protein